MIRYGEWKIRFKKEKKIDLRILKTKRNIYSTFESLMKKFSFEEIKVSDICELAMINRSTFYAHYNDKYELLKEYIESLKDMLTSELEKNTNINNSKEYYLEMIRLLFNHIEDKKETYSAIMKNNKNSITMDILYDVINKDVINQIKEKNENKGTNVPLDIVSKFYLGAVINICTEWITSSKYSKDELLRYFDILISDNLFC